MTFWVSCKKKNALSANTRINRVQRSMMYNQRIKFELNRKHSLDRIEKTVFSILTHAHITAVFKVMFFAVFIYDFIFI